jgi:hypothetical protein
VHAPAGQASPEFVAANWADIDAAEGARPFPGAVEALVAAFSGRSTRT